MTTKNNPTLEIDEIFTSLLEESFKNENSEGDIAKGKVIGFDRTSVLVDVGLKSEGRIPLKEFTSEVGTDLSKADVIEKPEIGDEIEVYIEKFEYRQHGTILSRERAIKDKIWEKFEGLFKEDKIIEGSVIGRVKGGFAVDIGGLIAFLPGSQVDIRPIKDVNVLVNIVQPFKILKMDKEHGNLVVSRRAIMEESRKEARDELLSSIKEGVVLDGVVKNLTDYGAFVDLKSTDGLLHITDISWSKISHPSEVLSIGQQIKVMVTKYNQETQRISLGLKQLTRNPWEDIATKYATGTEHAGKIVALTDYGAFVSLEPGVDGLVYHTEIHWTARNIHPPKLLKVGEEVKVSVLDIDIAKHRISLSIKRCQPNTWELFAQKYPVGTVLRTVIRNVSDFGLFVVAEENKDDEYALSLLIPANEISSNLSPEAAVQQYSRGEIIECIIINADPSRERITGSIKQLKINSMGDAISKFTSQSLVSGVVKAVYRDSIDVEIDSETMASIDRDQLAKQRDEQHTTNFTVGDKIDFKILSFNRESCKFVGSIRALQQDQESAAIAEYSSTSTGSSIGNILGDSFGTNNK